MKKLPRGCSYQGRYPDAEETLVEYGIIDDILISMACVFVFLLLINILL